MMFFGARKNCDMSVSRPLLSDAMRYCFLLFVSVFVIGISAQASDSPCQRIISFAPSITQIVQELGLQRHLVGVSLFDKLVSKEVARVGDLYGMNREALVMLKPTLVILLQEHRSFHRLVSDLRIPILSMDHSSVNHIRSSIQSLGRQCELESQAMKILTTLDKKMQNIRERLISLRKKTLNEVRVLVLIGNPTATHEGIGRLFLSGKDGFYSEVLSEIGIHSAYLGKTTGLSSFSLEGLMALNPTHIFHVIPSSENNSTLTRIEERWRKEFPMLRAVANGSIGASHEPFFLIPGVDYPKVAEAFANFVVGKTNEQS